MGWWIRCSRAWRSRCGAEILQQRLIAIKSHTERIALLHRGAPGAGKAGPLIRLLEQLQQGWIDQLRADPATAAWVEPATLAPLKRLIQLCDGISLWMCSSLIAPITGTARGIGEDAIELRDVPLRAWTDRCTITVTPLGGRRVKFDPYPFDIDPLPVMLPARIVDLPVDKPANFQTWWHARAPQRVEFTFVSGK